MVKDSKQINESEILTFTDRRKEYDFNWIICHSSDSPVEVHPLTVGPDSFDHTLFHTRGSNQPLFIPNVATNPSDALRWKIRALDRDILRSGLYQVVAGYHQLGKPGCVAAFHIMSMVDKPSRFRTINEAYCSRLRSNLPSLEGSDPADYINVHPSSTRDNASLGCFTIPDPIFTAFRKLFKDLEVGLMLFSREPNPTVKEFLK